MTAPRLGAGDVAGDGADARDLGRGEAELGAMRQERAAIVGAVDDVDGDEREGGGEERGWEGTGAWQVHIMARGI